MIQRIFEITQEETTGLFLFSDLESQYDLDTLNRLGYLLSYTFAFNNKVFAVCHYNPNNKRLGRDGL